MNSQTTPAKFRQAIISGSSLNHLQRISTKLNDIRCTDPSTRQTSLILAAFEGRLDICAWLILDENHEEVEISRDTSGETVLHIVASLGYTEILELYLSQYPFVLEWTTNTGSTPLHSASRAGHLSMINLLINSYGADINSPDLNGNTPLIYAATWGKLECLKFLVMNGAETGVVNNEGWGVGDLCYSFAVVRALDEYIQEYHEAQKQERRNQRKQSKLSTSTISQPEDFNSSPSHLNSRPPLLEHEFSSSLFGESSVQGYSLEDSNPSPNASTLNFPTEPLSPTTNSFPLSMTSTSPPETSTASTKNRIDPLTLSPLSSKDLRRSFSNTSSRASSIVSNTSNIQNSTLGSTEGRSDRSNSITSPLLRSTLSPILIAIPMQTSSSTGAPLSSFDNINNHNNRREASSTSSNSYNSSNSNSHSQSTRWNNLPPTLEPFTSNSNSTNSNSNLNTNTNTTITPSTPKPRPNLPPQLPSKASINTTISSEAGQKLETKIRNGSESTTGGKMARAFGLRRKT